MSDSASALWRKGGATVLGGAGTCVCVCNSSQQSQTGEQKSNASVLKD